MNGDDGDEREIVVVRDPPYPQASPYLLAPRTSCFAAAVFEKMSRRALGRLR